MIELVEVDYLPETLKEDKHGRRPWEVNEANAHQCRCLFPLWMRERHGIVVYECGLMDSSAMGNKTFAPRMIDTVEAGMQPAPRIRNADLASTQEHPVDWIDASAIPGASPEEIIERCFFFEDEEGVRRHLMSGLPITTTKEDA